MIRGAIRPTGIVQTCKQTAEATNSVIASPTDIPGLSFSLFANHRYWFRFIVNFQTDATTTGAGFALTAPSMTAGTWTSNIQQAASGTDQMFVQTSITLGALVASSVVAANTTYIAILEGFCEPSASGTLQLKARTEVGASVLTVLNTGMGILIDAG